ncbi:unnamed protein product [Boreogadus saida]
MKDTCSRNHKVGSCRCAPPLLFSSCPGKQDAVADRRSRIPKGEAIRRGWGIYPRDSEDMTAVRRGRAEDCLGGDSPGCPAGLSQRQPHSQPGDTAR